MRPLSFKERLTCAWLWDRVRPLLIADTLIALLLFVLTTLADRGENWFYHLAANFIFSHAIGTSIYCLVWVTGLHAVEKPWKKFLGLTGIFILGAWIGAWTALGIFDLLFEPNLDVDLRYFIRLYWK